MIYTLKYALAFVIIALTLSTPAKADSTTAGTPITAENVVAHSYIIRIADTLDSSVDAKNWALARSLFTDQIEVDFTSLVGGEPANIASDDLISGWSANLKGDKSSFHMRSNHRITFQDANNATMTSHGYAWNKIERGAARRLKMAEIRYGKCGERMSTVLYAHQKAGALML